MILVVLIILAASGFFYQVANRLTYFLSDPTNINILVNEDESVALPTIAVCRPGIYRGHFSGKEHLDVSFHTANVISYQKEDLSLIHI